MAGSSAPKGCGCWWHTSGPRPFRPSFPPHHGWPAATPRPRRPGPRPHPLLRPLLRRYRGRWRRRKCRRKYGCTACHAVDHKLVGPALKDVGAKYRGKDVEATLVHKVRNGGSGVWGQVPMAPNPQVPEPDLHAIVKWVLTLK